MGAKLTSQKSSKLESAADLKEDKVNYAPVPFGQLLEGKVGKFTVKVEQMEEQLLTFLQEEAWLHQSDEQLLQNGFSKVIQTFLNYVLIEDHNSDEGPSPVGE